MFTYLCAGCGQSEESKSPNECNVVEIGKSGATGYMCDKCIKSGIDKRPFESWWISIMNMFV